MIRRCYACRRQFRPSDAVEQLRCGSSVAYDPARGRLWIICDHCSRWNLAPIESRWEAVDALERAVRGSARLRTRTTNVALFHTPSLDIVRVGEPDTHEECWWRYGRQFRRRRLRYAMAAGVGATTVIAGVAGVGILTLSLLDLVLAGWVRGRRDPALVVAEIAGSGARTAAALDRRARFGRLAWRGELACARCGAITRELAFRDRSRLEIRADWMLRLRCPDCDSGRVAFDAVESRRVLRRALAYHNFAGGTRRQIGHAARAIDSGDELLRDGRYVGFGDGVGYELLALEMIVTRLDEAEQLRLEISEIEARWRAEEEIAVIADGELTPLPNHRTMPGER